VVEGLLDSDASAVGAFTARFAGVVFPGETIRTRAWNDDERIVVAATISSADGHRDDAPVLADCVLMRA
jgi:acyl dehydratase